MTDPHGIWMPTAPVTGRRRRLPAAHLVVVAAIFVGLSVASLAISAYRQRESDQRWCALLITLDDSYRAAPPPSETGRIVAARIAELRVEFDCGPAAGSRPTTGR